MAAKHQGLKAWVAAASVASVVVGTAYFARTANGESGATLSAADAAGQASAPASRLATGSANATTAIRPAAAPAPVRARRSRGS